MLIAAVTQDLMPSWPNRRMRQSSIRSEILRASTTTPPSPWRLQLSTAIEPGLLRPENNNMRIQINADRNIDGHERPATVVRSSVVTALARLSNQVTRSDRRLSNQNSGKRVGSDNLRCLMEVRLEGPRPIAVTHDAAIIVEAVDGATGKLSRNIDSNLGKLRNKHSRSGISLPAAEAPVDEQ